MEKVEKSLLRRMSTASRLTSKLNESKRRQYVYLGLSAFYRDICHLGIESFAGYPRTFPIPGHVPFSSTRTYSTLVYYYSSTTSEA